MSFDCDYCRKQGIPILPLRYGVAAKFGSAAGHDLPEVADNPLKLPASVAYTTRRVLRAGYLYVYVTGDEVVTEYAVSVDGYYYKLAERNGKNPAKIVATHKPFACTQPEEPAHRAKASVITVTITNPTQCAWLGFSDVQWTAATCDKHIKDEALRNTHMRKVTPDNFAASPDKQHCFDIKQAAQQVAEYKHHQGHLDKTLGFSPFDEKARSHQTALLLQQVEAIKPKKGFAVVVSDPVGVAAELDGLMTYALDYFNNAPVRKRQVRLSGALGMIETAVKEQAKDATLKSRLESPQLYTVRKGLYTEQEKQTKLANATLSPEKLNGYGERAWQPYAAKLDISKRDLWRKEYDIALKQLDKTYIQPLAKAHVGILESQSMQQYFASNYDPLNVGAGSAYAQALGLSIGNSQDKKACYDLYTKWLNEQLKSKSQGKNNILLNALTLNLESLKERVAGIHSSSMDWASLPWDGLIAHMEDQLGLLADAGIAAVTRLMAQVGGPITGVLMDAALLARPPSTVMIMGMVSRTAITRVTVRGTQMSFYRLGIEERLKITAKQLSGAKLHLTVEAELKYYEAYGAKFNNAIQTKQLLVVANRRVDAIMGASSTQQTRAAWLHHNIQEVSQLRQLDIANWHTESNPPSSNTNPAAAIKLSSAMPYGVGVVCLLLQGYAVSKMLDDEGGAMSFAAPEAKQRLMAGIGVLSGTVVEMMGKIMEGVAKFIKRELLGIVGRGFQWVGKYLLGLPASLFMAYLDLIKSGEYRTKGDYGMAALYFVSFGLGAATALSFLIATRFFALTMGLFIAFLVVALLIELFKDNAIQEWLEHCLWGRTPANTRDTTGDFEMLDLQRTLKA